MMMRTPDTLAMAAAAALMAAVGPVFAGAVVQLSSLDNAVLVNSDPTPWNAYQETCPNVVGGGASCNAGIKPVANSNDTVYVWGGEGSANNSVINLQWTGAGHSAAITSYRLLTPKDKDGNVLQNLGTAAGPMPLDFGGGDVVMFGPKVTGSGAFLTYGRDTSDPMDNALVQIRNVSEFRTALTVGVAQASSRPLVGSGAQFWSPPDLPTASSVSAVDYPLSQSNTVSVGGFAPGGSGSLRFFDSFATGVVDPIGYVGNFYLQFNAPTGNTASVLSQTTGFGSAGAVRAGSGTVVTGQSFAFNQGGPSSELVESVSTSGPGAFTTTLDAVATPTGAGFSLDLAEQATRGYSFTPGTLTSIAPVNRSGVQSVFTQQIASATGGVVKTNQATITTVGPLLGVSPDSAFYFGPGDVIDLGDIDVNTTRTMLLTVSNLFGRGVGAPDFGDLTALTLHNMGLSGGSCPGCFGLLNAGAFNGLVINQDSDAPSPLVVAIDAPFTPGMFTATLTFYTDQNLAFGVGGPNQNGLSVTLRMFAVGAPVPAPATALLIGVGLAGLSLRRRARG